MIKLRSLQRQASERSAAVEIVGCRWQRASRLVICGFAFSLAALLALPFDRSVAIWFADYRLPGEFVHLLRLAEIFGWGGGAAMIILTAARLDLRGWQVGLPLAIHSLGAGLTADAIKLLIARSRPMATEHAATVSETFVAALPLLNADELKGGYGHHVQSFPSAHAATAAGLAIALSAFYPRGRWLFAIFALLAMLQRVEAHAHYISDVLAGAAVAFFVAAIYVNACHSQKPGPNLVSIGRSTNNASGSKCAPG
jgi:membrane-associated phospholipid phosphatase